MICLLYTSEPNYSAVKDYAVNGAVHYGNAVLDEGTYNEAIVVGVNGTALDDAGNVADAECKAYYISEKNNRIPKLIEKITADDWSLLNPDNVDGLFRILDKLNLTDAEIEELTRRTEVTLEEKSKSIHPVSYTHLIMENIKDTVDIVKVIKPVYNFKAH